MDNRELAEALLDSLLGPEQPPTDDIRPPVLEIKLDRMWIEVDEETWRSWTGLRRVNGTDHHGPVYSFLTPEGAPPFTGKRVCGCAACQEHVEPRHRLN